MDCLLKVMVWLKDQGTQETLTRLSPLFLPPTHFRRDSIQAGRLPEWIVA